MSKVYKIRVWGKGWLIRVVRELKSWEWNIRVLKVESLIRRVKCYHKLISLGLMAGDLTKKRKIWLLDSTSIFW